MKTWRKQSNSQEETEEIARGIGSRMRGGEVIELVSDLGGGKTAFVRGLAKGLGSYDHVASPTFTISREYRAGDLTMYHFDFYRLSEPGIMSTELAEFIGDDKAIVAVEWSDIVQHVLPPKRLTVKLTFSGDMKRNIEISYPASLAYLIGGKDT